MIDRSVAYFWFLFSLISFFSSSYIADELQSFIDGLLRFKIRGMDSSAVRCQTESDLLTYR